MQPLSQPISDDLLEGAAAAAAHLGLKPGVVYRLTAGGHLPVIRLGRKFFYRKSDLERAFASV